MKITVLCVLSAVILLLFARCDDSLEIKQAYPFKLYTWYLQKSIRNGEAVEIRFTLERSGVYEDAKYYIGYIQTGGKGEVFDLNETLLINRELHALDDMAGIDKEAPLHISNVMLVVDGQATRVGFQMDGDKKVRVAKKTGKVID